LDATVKGATSGSDDDIEEGTDEEEFLSPSELAALKKELTAAKKSAKALAKDFVAKLTAARRELSPDDGQCLVLRIARADLADHLDAYVAKHRGLVAAALEKWWDKYAITLKAIEADRDVARHTLNGFLRELGYE
jgi:type I restriction enzyme M protein